MSSSFLFTVALFCFLSFSSLFVSPQSLYQSRRLDRNLFDANLLSDSNIVAAWNAMPNNAFSNGQYCDAEISDWQGISNSGVGLYAQGKVCLNGVYYDLFYHMAAVFFIQKPGLYSWRWAADVYYGGIMLIDNKKIQSRWRSDMPPGSDGMFWDYSWADTSQYLVGYNISLAAGFHTMEVYGAEDCCDGGQGFEFDSNDGTGFRTLSTAFLPLSPPTSPTIYSFSPKFASTSGGTNITVIGKNFILGGATPFVQLQSTTVTPFPWVSPAIYCPNAFTCTFLLPAGSGSPLLQFSALGSIVLPLPRWPTDVFFASPPAANQKAAQCVKLFNPGNTALGWADSELTSQDFLCSVDSTSAVGFQFFFGAAPPSNYLMSCLNFNGLDSTWATAQLCYPSVTPYQFQLFTDGSRPAGLACMAILKASDPVWAAGNVVLCSQPNMPYGGQVFPRYSYSPPVITGTASTLSGSTAGGNSITLTVSSLGFNSNSNFTRPTVQIGSPSQLCAITAISATQFTCTIPAGEGINLPITITTDGLTSAVNAAFYYNYNAPQLTSFSSTLPLTAGGGSPLTILGSNFGSTLVTVTIAAYNCPVQSQSNSQIVCTLPAGQGTGLLLQVTTAAAVGGRSSNTLPFSYQPPQITSVSPTSGSTSSVITFTITGSSFGSSSLGNSITFKFPPSPYRWGATSTPAALSCLVNTWSETKISCRVDRGYGFNMTVAVSVGGQVNDWSSAAKFDYDAPILTSVTPSQALTGRSVLLTLTGLNFGRYTLQPQNYVIVGSLLCTVQQAAQYSDSTIICLLPDQAGDPLPIAVTVWNQRSNSFNFSYSPVFQAPSGPFLTSGNYLMNLTGCQNFGTARELIFDDVNIIQFQTCYFPTPICSFLFPAEMGFSHTLTVRTNGILPPVSQRYTFTFDYGSPSLTSFSPQSGPGSGNYTMILRGQNFGNPAIAQPSEILMITIGGIPCPILTYNDTIALCSVPAGSGTANLIRLQVGYQQNIEALNFVYFGPTILSINSTNNKFPITGGIPIVLNGLEFRGSIAVNFGSNVFSIPAANVTIYSIQLMLPAGAGSVTVLVTANGQQSNGFIFNYDSPILISFTSNQGANPRSNGGGLLTLSGLNFGPPKPAAASDLTVRIFPLGRICALTGSTTDNQITCSLPPTEGGSGLIQLVGNAGSSNFIPIIFAAPSILTAPSTGPTSGGVIAISGDSLGTAAAGGSITVGSFPCDYSTGTWSHTQISCTLPPLEGQNLPILISRSGQNNSAQVTQFFYSVDPPVIDTVIAAPSGQTQGGTILTVTGNNFGFNASINFNGSFTACRYAGPPFFPSSFIAYCVLPAGQGMNIPIFVRVGPSNSPISTQFSYDPPVLGSDALTRLSTSNANGPVLGGKSVTLYGKNFGAAGSNTITFNGVQLAPAAILSVAANRTQLVFQTPVGLGTGIPISITVAGQSASIPAPAQNSFTFDSPVINSVSGCSLTVGPSTFKCPIAPTLADRLTIVGKNFGLWIAQTTVELGGSALTLVSVVDTQIIAQLPSRPTGGYNLQIRVETRTLDAIPQRFSTLSSLALVSYTGPSITSNSISLLTLSSAPETRRRLLGIGSNVALNTTAGGATIELKGQSFGNNITAISIRYGLNSSLTATDDGSASSYASKVYNCVPFYLFTDGADVSTVRCTLDAGVGSNLVFQLKLLLQYSLESADSISYPPPQIIPNSLRLDSPDNSGRTIVLGQSTQGDLVVFSGKFLGPMPPNPTISNQITVKFTSNGIDYSDCTSVSLMLYNSIPTVSCFTGLGSGLNYKFQVFHMGRPEMASALGTDVYNYISPISIFSVSGCTDVGSSTNNCPTAGGTQIKITTSVLAQGSILVRIGSSLCLNPSNNSATEVTCTLPPGAGSNVSVSVSAGVTYSLPSYSLSYAPPSFTSVSGCSSALPAPAFASAGVYDCLRSGGQRLTLSGSDFGPENATVVVAGRLCTNVQHVSNQLRCSIPAGTEINQPIIVIQNGGQAAAAPFFISFRQCDPGTFSDPFNPVNCINCLAGSYSDSASSTSCKSCAVGKFAATPGFSSCSNCFAGEFSVTPASNYSTIYGFDLGSIACQKCPIGRFNPVPGSPSCVDCPSGGFANSTGSTVCYDCRPGFFSVGSSTFCQACSIGRYASVPSAKSCDVCPPGTSSTNGSTSCVSCSVGTFATNSGTALGCQPCNLGSFTSSVGQSSCGLCSAGRFANVTQLANCFDCPPGTNSIAGQSACSPCFEGQFSTNGGAFCQLCPQGFYSGVRGSSVCSPCDRGSYADLTGRSLCTLCPAGQYASVNGSLRCVECLPGFAQAATGSSSCSPCSRGSFQPVQGRSFCFDCRTGQYNPSFNQLSCIDCPAGSFSNTSAASQCFTCGPGQFSALNRNPLIVNRCISGTCVNEAVAGVTGCSNCLAGQFSATSGVSACSDCDFGTFSSNPQSSSCQKCSAGSSASSRGSAGCTDCFVGYFASQPGLRFCLPCDPGQYAANRSSTACIDCAVGTVASNPNSGQCTNCSAGTIASSIRSVSCPACEAGSYSSFPGSSVCSPCTLGKYSSSTASTSCRNANPGYFVNTVGAISQRPCDAGFITVSSGLSSCSACQPGKFAGGTGLSFCSNCTRGSFTDSFGAQICTPCSAGFVGLIPGLSQCDPCAAGTFADQSGRSVCQPCSPGFAQSSTGQSVCYRCHFGQSAPSPGRKSCEDCLAGTYSTQSPSPTIGVVNCVNCPPATFQDAQGQNGCKSCPVGRAGNSTGLAICPACNPGFYSDRTNSPVCSPCKVGYFSSSSGAAACSPCPAGRFGNSTAASVCNQCSVGLFQPYVAQTNCSLCPAGKFSSAPGNPECQDCQSGEYSSSPASTICRWCDVGYYQSSASQTSCLACPIGFYSSSNHSTVCTICARGSFAPRLASSSCPLCAPGSFAVSQGSSNCSLCDFGTSAPGTGSSICLRCSEQAGSSVASSRLYADERGLPNCKICELHSSSDQSEVRCLCDVGFAYKYPSYRGFRINGTASCAVCPLGAICNNLGTLWDEMKTAEGYWEPGNKVYKKCSLQTNCPGGATELKLLKDLFPAQTLNEIMARLNFYNTSAMASPCGANRFGPMCALCRPGWIEGFGGVCFPCTTNGASWFILAVIIVAILVVLSLSYYLLLFADRAALNQAAEEERIKIREMAGYVEDYDVNTEMKKSRYDEWVTTKGAARPKANYLFKVKIFISFAQIITNIAIGIPISWPERFKSVIAFLVPVNFDFIQVSSIGCVVETSYYRKITGVIVYPIMLILAILVFYWIPQLRKYQETKNWEHSIARKMIRKNSWKLIFFTLFFVYPNVSSTLLRIFVCEEVAGFYYLQSDFTVNCFTSEWDSYAAISVLFIIFYAIGTPVLFFTALYRSRRRLTEIGVRAELGFLYDAFEREVWWFEVLDMAHKLLLTSLIVFLPQLAQMPVAMVGSVLYTFSILIVKPYIRQSDDRLHLLCQTEILLLLLCGHVFYYEGNTDTLMDLTLTVILLLLIFGTILFFVLQSWVAVWKRLKYIFSKRERQREIAAGKSVRTWADLEEMAAEKTADSAAKRVEAMEEDSELVKRDTYADVLPIINRRDLAPQSRNLAGLAGGGRLEMKRNLAFGVDGNNAIYDPVTDDVIEEAIANPLHAGLNEEDELDLGPIVGDWGTSSENAGSTKSMRHQRLNSGHIHPNPLIAAKLVYARKFDFLNEREKNEKKLRKQQPSISVSQSDATIGATVEPDWNSGSMRIPEHQQLQLPASFVRAGPQADAIEMPEIELASTLDDIPLDDNGRLSTESGNRVEQFEVTRAPAGRRKFGSIEGMPKNNIQ